MGRDRILIAGGGIGGLAAALALAQKGIASQVLEKASQLGEIGAGIQLGPNAFHCFDRLGVGEAARKMAVYIDQLILECAKAIGEPAILAGHSLGGTFATIFASLHPERVRALILLEAPLSFSGDSGASTKLIRIVPTSEALRKVSAYPGTVLNALSLVASPAAAANYSAKLSAPVSQRIIARDISWNCGPAACQGATEESRPFVLCQGLAKKAGRIESFAVDGRALPSAELDKCNHSAKAQAAQALAAQ